MDNQDIKKGVGAPKKTESGWKDDYKNKKYHLQYYYAHKTTIKCDCCGKENINRATIMSHKKSRKCIDTVKIKKLQDELNQLKTFNETI